MKSFLDFIIISLALPESMSLIGSRPYQRNHLYIPADVWQNVEYIASVIAQFELCMLLTIDEA